MLGTSSVNDFLDSSTSMTPMQKIRAAAKQQGVRLQLAKQNCKHCHGRGYIGLNHETGDPVPCRCIFVKEENNVEVGEVELKPKNRAERRARAKEKKRK